MDSFKQFSLKGKTALVTGCSTGLGKAMALALAAAGADIIGVARSFVNSETATLVEALGVSFSGYHCDFASRESLYHFIAAVRAEQPSLDILINNAGTIIRAPLVEHDDDSWDRVLEINLSAQFILSREFGKGMLEAGRGNIVFICSMLSYQGGINVASYTASKSALSGLVKAFANEWAGKGIRVNGIAPGYFVTNNTKPLQDDPVRAATILDRIPAGRWGVPEDLAGPVVFLCSAAGDYVHGTVLNVDGGWLAR